MSSTSASTSNRSSSETARDASTSAPGPSASAPGQRSSPGKSLRAIAADLLTAHNENTCLAVLDMEDSMFIDLEETSHPVRLVTYVGSRTPAFASASGRVILADRAPEVVAAEYAGRTMVTPTGRRLRGLQELQEILSRVRAQGYAENEEETAVGLYSV